FPNVRGIPWSEDTSANVTGIWHHVENGSRLRTMKRTFPHETPMEVVCMNIPGLLISHIGGRGGLLALFLLVLTSIGCSVCNEDVKEEVKSPDGKYIAVVYMRNCGATTSIQFHVNLRRSWGWFSHKPEGSIQDGQVFLTETGTIKVTWRDNNNLHI